jgi:hypothetical protein
MITEKSITMKYKHEDGWEYHITVEEDGEFTEISISYWEGDYDTQKMIHNINFFGPESIPLLESALSLAKEYYGHKKLP